MIVLRNIFFLFLFISSAFINAQEIDLQYVNTPLNKILIDIRDKNDIHISFDDRLLSKYEVTINKTFPSPEMAIGNLIAPYPLTFEKNNDVFVIYKLKKVKRSRSFLLAGQIVDATNQEPLPYSHIIINGQTFATDVKGSFSYLSVTDSIFLLKASQLGYYILDTILVAEPNLSIKLYHSSIG